MYFKSLSAVALGALSLSGAVSARMQPRHKGAMRRAQDATSQLNAAFTTLQTDLQNALGQVQQLGAGITQMTPELQTAIKAVESATSQANSKVNSVVKTAASKRQEEEAEADIDVEVRDAVNPTAIVNNVQSTVSDLASKLGASGATQELNALVQQLQGQLGQLTSLLPIGLKRDASDAVVSSANTALSSFNSIVTSLESKATGLPVLGQQLAPAFQNLNNVIGQSENVVTGLVSQLTPVLGPITQVANKLNISDAFSTVAGLLQGLGLPL